MKELHNIILQFCFLIILISIVILIKQYPSIDKKNVLKSFEKFYKL
jgi:hypothetical protein